MYANGGARGAVVWSRTPVNNLAGKLGTGSIALDPGSGNDPFEIVANDSQVARLTSAGDWSITGTVNESVAF